MGAPELPDLDDDDLRPAHIIHQEGESSDEESDDETQHNRFYYQPLPLDDGELLPHNNNEHNYDIEDEAVNNATANNIDEILPVTNDNNLPPIVSVDTEVQRDVWNQPRPRELRIELDNNKTQQILDAMANFNLSNITIPEWAVGVPEEHWKEALLQRIDQRKSTQRSNDVTNVNLELDKESN